MEQHDVENKEESISNKSNEKGKQPERENFANNFEFILSCLGLAVGLGNIWRFPTRAYENGGSAFLIPYLTCAVLFGLPTVYLEFLAGQYQRASPPIVFRRIMPALEGIGWMCALISTLVSIYYVAIISWICIYIMNIFRGHLDIWNRCDNPWNVKDSCVDMLQQKLCNVAGPVLPMGSLKNEKQIYLNGKCLNLTSLKNVTVMSATEQYFKYNILAPSNGLYDINGINWPILSWMTFCWILTALLMWKGMKVIGKVSYVTVVLPYALIIVLAIRGVTLEGASTGLYFYFGKPDISKIWSFRTWSEALKQLCFSLALGYGGLMSMASYSAKRHNCFRDALIIIIGDTLMSVIGGAAVFSILGFLAVQRGVTVPEVVQSGLSLVFVVYPEAMTQMPLPWLWTLLFFMMLFLLAISSEVAMAEVFCSCLYDQHKSLRNKKLLVVSAWCSILFLFGLIFATDAGIYWFELYDEYGSGFSSVFAVIIEIVALIWVYGASNFRQDIIEMIGEANSPLSAAIGPLSPYFFFNWKIISPIFAMILISFSFMREYPYNGDAEKYPILFDMIGWFLSALPALAIPIIGVRNYIWFKKNGYNVSGLTMLQKQHNSYERISADYDEEMKEFVRQLPDREPWDMEENIEV